MARERGDDLLASWIQHPALEAEARTDLENRLDRSCFVAKIAYSDGVFGVPREARDRVFVVDDARWNALPPEAPNDAKAEVIATAYDGTYGFGASAWMSAYLPHGPSSVRASPAPAVGPETALRPTIRRIRNPPPY